MTRQRSLLWGIPVWGPWQVCQGRHRDFGHLQLDNANGMAPHSVVWPNAPGGGRWSPGRAQPLSAGLELLGIVFPVDFWAQDRWISVFKCQGRTDASRQHLQARGSQQPSLHLGLRNEFSQGGNGVPWQTKQHCGNVLTLKVMLTTQQSFTGLLVSVLLWQASLSLKNPGIGIVLTSPVHGQSYKLWTAA